MPNFALTAVPLRAKASALAYVVLIGATAGVSLAETVWSIDTVGYPPRAAKVATLAIASANPGDLFRVAEYDSQAVVFEGQLKASPAGDALVADFSAVSTPGRYALVAGDALRSPPFAIDSGVYSEAFRLTLQAMKLWRCGCAVSATHAGETFAHEACHLHDAYHVVDGALVRRDGAGGWHDAGDYNKYVVNAGVSVGCLLKAWRDFAPAITAATDTALLDELRWELDWLLKLQNDDGSVAHKVSTRDFGPFILPEEERERRYFSDWGTAATASFVAMTAAASRTFELSDAAYAQRLRNASLKSYAKLLRHPEDRTPDLELFSTGTYQSADRDDRLWAFAEVWETTGEDDDLRRLEEAISRHADGSQRRRRRDTHSEGAFETTFDWGNVANLGLMTYLESSRSGRSPALVERLRTGLRRTADRLVETAAEHPYGRPAGERYGWGCNGVVARQVLLLEAANLVEPRQAYSATGLDAVHHLFGRNLFGRSQVTGLGHHPPRHPHDRRSGADRVASPWPGYLVGGPNRGPTDWRDDQDDFRTNEIAINWNAALVYALAAQLPDTNDSVR
ncbi:Endoglucanase D precursor [Botrimarina colliarenosi]|uniref:Endoglucanase n=1 Tax=Botrimarina colliarenosi TaxID=2528001 RepID=A0A5C6A130_9BACT|nr:glycoside hydrolase family 9 protein [Botrimarina colliarenosi]TWT92908.1 Endoglucanase D precursor [Botrimarina colliarenosi]